MSRRTNESLLDHTGEEPARKRMTPAAFRITIAAAGLFWTVCVGMALYLNGGL